MNLLLAALSLNREAAALNPGNSITSLKGLELKKIMLSNL
jgi:hypothetical protein